MSASKNSREIDEEWAAAWLRGEVEGDLAVIKTSHLKAMWCIAKGKEWDTTRRHIPGTTNRGQIEAYLRSVREAGWSKSKPKAPAAAPCGGAGVASPAAAAADDGDAPSADSYRLRLADVNNGVCLGRHIDESDASKDRRWKPAVYRESQCGKPVMEGSDLCTVCCRRQEKFADEENAAEAMKIGWLGRVTEEPPEWCHMLGTAWAEAKKPKWRREGWKEETTEKPAPKKTAAASGGGGGGPRELGSREIDEEWAKAWLRGEHEESALDDLKTPYLQAVWGLVFSRNKTWCVGRSTGKDTSVPLIRERLLRHRRETAAVPAPALVVEEVRPPPRPTPEEEIAALRAELAATRARLAEETAQRERAEAKLAAARALLSQ